MIYLIIIAVFATIAHIKRGIERRRILNVAADMCGQPRQISVTYYLLEKANYWLRRKLS